MRRFSVLGLVSSMVLLAFAIGCSGGDSSADAPKPDSNASSGDKPADDAPVAKADFASVKTGMDSFCLPCHNATNKQGGLDVTAFKTEADIDKAAFAKMASELESKKMPPGKAEKQPTDEERAAMVTGLKALGM
ncbi:MAG: hypothetical protein ABL949_09795 [Fimbriimonadaceae bacterium]